MSKQKYPVPIHNFRLVSMTKNRLTEVTRHKVSAYRDTVWIGEEIMIPQGRKARVKKKHPWIVFTDKGSFQWVDIYMLNVRHVDSSETGYEYFEI